jgi:hypothetical protein
LSVAGGIASLLNGDRGQDDLPIASEPSHRSDSTRCANCGHPVNNNVVRMSFVLLVSVFGVATPVG